MTLSQELALSRHGLTRHSTRKGWVISKASDGWAITSPDGNTEFHIHSLEIARAEIDCA